MQDAPYMGIPLHDRRGEIVAFALIDFVDAAHARHRWRRLPKGYAARQGPKVNGRQTTIYLHREVLGLTRGDGVEADHINGDRLDNRRANLRAVTRAQNGQNLHSYSGKTSSQHRGVSWDSRRRKWRSAVKVDGRKHELGYFADEAGAAEAARAFRAAHMPFSAETL